MSSSGKKPQNKIAFGDLGLKTVIPQCFLKTKKEKAEERRLAKKDTVERVKQATAELAGRRGEVVQLKEFEQQQREAERVERQERRQKLQGERVQAQVAREQKHKKTVADMRQAQAEASERNVGEQLAQRHEEEETRQAILADEELRIAAAPKAVYIHVERTPEISETRGALPVLAEEQAIMEHVNDTAQTGLIVCGQTGSGKTTQVPQFLWEAGYGHEAGSAFGRSGMIAVTEPRRVAAVAMSQRVALELNEPFGDTVCYHVRYNNNLSPNCKLKFMTEGILLREIQEDFLLRKYSAVVVDEAHERSVSCDVLLGLLSRIVPLRRAMSEEQRDGDGDGGGKIAPLRLVIMSATLRIEDFRDSQRLFNRPPPVVNVDARMFSVSSHFARRTELHRYVEQAFDKVKQIHKKLPPGGILIFLSTQREIESLCAQLRAHYAKTRILYDADRYGKHALLASRKHGAAPPQQGQEEGEGEAAEKDEFGLFTKEYALEGDDDAASDDGNGNNSNNQRAGDHTIMGDLRDDFDYTCTAQDDIGESFDDGAAAEVSSGSKKKKRKKEKQVDGGIAGNKDNTTTTKKSKKKKVQSTGGLFSTDEQDEWCESEEDEEDEEADGPAVDAEDEADGAFDTLHVLPLYSLLPMKDQQRVFDDVPKGKRLCVVATNVAETSITIPCIRYVVDTGRVKQKVLQPDTGAQVYQIQWTSQSSAQQRLGRAGRTGPGHCYRLYSTAVFSNWMSKHSEPEIVRTPLESVVLMMKDMGIEHVAKFPFPTPPAAGAIQSAVEHLVRIGALERDRLCCSALGSQLLAYPVTPRLAKMIYQSAALYQAVKSASEGAGKKSKNKPSSVSDESARRVMKAMHIIVAVANVSVDIMRTTDWSAAGSATSQKRTKKEREEEKLARAAAGKGPSEIKHAGSDLITFLRAFIVFAAKPTVAECNRYGLVHKSMTEAAQLCRQLERLTINEVLPRMSAQQQQQQQQHTSAIEDFDFNNEDIFAEVKTATATVTAATPTGVQEEFSLRMDANLLSRLTRDEEITIRKLVTIGLIDQVARRATPMECRTHRVALKENLQKTSKTPYLHLATMRIVFVHPASSIATTHPPPEYVAFALLQANKRGSQGSNAASSGGGGDEAHVFMKGCTVLTKAWLDELGFVEDEE